jgi:hypothetical protein
MLERHGHVFRMRRDSVPKRLDVGKALLYRELVEFKRNLERRRHAASIESQSA